MLSSKKQTQNLSRHHSRHPDQISERSQVSKVTLCVQTIMWQSITTTTSHQVKIGVQFIIYLFRIQSWFFHSFLSFSLLPIPDHTMSAFSCLSFCWLTPLVASCHKTSPWDKSPQKRMSLYPKLLKIAAWEMLDKGRRVKSVEGGVELWVEEKETGVTLPVKAFPPSLTTNFHMLKPSLPPSLTTNFHMLKPSLSIKQLISTC